MTYRERPILFSAPMVREIINSSKTQTRRVVKPVGNDDGFVLLDHGNGWWPYRSDDGESSILSNGNETPHSCPYGQPGDRLWVRENGWERPDRTPEMMREGADTWEPFYFDADGYGHANAEQFKKWGFKRRPWIHMPRLASRITLEVTGVRVEQLQDISDADAFAEGITVETVIVGCNCNGGRHSEETAERYFHNGGDDEGYENPQDAYASLWESINGAGSWGANPWVWVIEFRRMA